MNKQDKKLLAEVTVCFDQASIKLIEFSQDIANTEVRLGTASKVVIKQKEQLERFRLLYDKALEYINFLRDLNVRMMDQAIAKELMRVKESTGLPMANIMSIAGDDFDKWAKVDKLDDLIKDVHQKLGLSQADEDLNTFVTFLKGGN